MLAIMAGFRVRTCGAPRNDAENLLERNLVVHVVALAGHGGLTFARSARRAGGAEYAIGGPVLAAATTAASAAVEHGQNRIEALQHGLGRIAILARLVLPFARLQLAFDVNLGAFFEVLLGDLAKPI